MTSEEYFKQHGISQDSIEKFNITTDEKKITIPIKDEKGKVLFHKYRHLDFDKNKPNSVKFTYEKGSHAAIFNIQALDKANDYVILTEGEFDTIRLDQEGLFAVSNTSGANTFKPEWVELFSNKKVYILYDNDDAGRSGAARVKELIPHALIITLPPKYKDVCEYFIDFTREDLETLVKTEQKKNSITYQELCQVINKWLLLVDNNVIKVYLATLVSHFFSTDPLWMFFVAPPSGSKTEIISTGEGLPFVHMLSTLTSQTLVSGLITKNKDPSLLMQLKNNVLIMKDFTTILSMRQEERQVILSQLREVYDGKFSKAYGTGKKVDWKGRLTLIAGVTTIIDTHSAMSQVMGERFLIYRVPQANDEDVAIKSLMNYGTEEQMRTELQEAMHKFFNSLVIPHVTEIELPMDILKSLASLASFIVKARSALVRDPYKKELLYIPKVEAPARLAKQLGTLIKALPVLENRKKVSWQDFYLTMRVALDVIPNNRMKHIIALCGSETPSMTTAEIALKSGYSFSGAELILEDLSAVELVERDYAGMGSSTDWKLSTQSFNYFKKILPFYDKTIHQAFQHKSEHLPLIKEMLKSSNSLPKELQGNTIGEDFPDKE